MVREGSLVKWKWGNGFAEGKVIETFTDDVTKKIKGTEVTRKGSVNNKALYIVQEDGSKVLKLEQEIERIK